jgi:hypothetical protein
MREPILRWLESYDNASKHYNILSKRQEGTGNWFVTSHAYQLWQDQPRSQKRLCTGLPGAGKTMLTSLAIDDLQRRCRTDPSLGLAYLYCEYRSREDLTVELALLSLLKQLVERQTLISGSVEQFW